MGLDLICFSRRSYLLSKIIIGVDLKDACWVSEANKSMDSIISFCRLGSQSIYVTVTVRVSSYLFSISTCGLIIASQRYHKDNGINIVATVLPFSNARRVDYLVLRIINLYELSINTKTLAIDSEKHRI